MTASGEKYSEEGSTATLNNFPQKAKYHRFGRTENLSENRRERNF
jgi:hypothetical protein